MLARYNVIDDFKYCAERRGNVTPDYQEVQISICKVHVKEPDIPQHIQSNNNSTASSGGASNNWYSKSNNAKDVDQNNQE